LGGLAAQWGLSPKIHLMIMLVVVTLLTMLLLGGFEAAPHRPRASSEDVQTNLPFAWPTPAILMLVVATFAAMLMEGAGIDWSAIYMRDVFSSSPFVCGLAVAAGASTQAVTRFFADRLVERFQPVRVARGLILILGLGVCAVTWASVEWVALLGFALMGIGTSAIFPLAMSAAAQRTDRTASVNVAALAQTSFVIFLIGPPLLGGVAEFLGIRATFAISLPLIVLSFWASKSLKN
jgi:MFS family permease